VLEPLLNLLHGLLRKNYQFCTKCAKLYLPRIAVKQQFALQAFQFLHRARHGMR